MAQLLPSVQRKSEGPVTLSKTLTDPAQTKLEARSQLRSSMFVAAVLRAGAEQAPVKVRNMSPSGAMIESPLAPPPGTNVHLIRGSLQGTVVWNADNRCGLSFSSDLSVKEWLAPPAKAEQQRVDDIVALIRAGAAPAESPGIASASAAPRSEEELVDDLGDVVRLMQDLEDDLASSSDTLSRHAVKLQNLDIAMQMIRAIAHELTSECDRKPVGLAKLRDLRAVCAQALGSSQKG